MHWQTDNYGRERDHRISLMPIERPSGDLSLASGIAWVVSAMVLFAMAYVVGAGVVS